MLKECHFCPKYTTYRTEKHLGFHSQTSYSVCVTVPSSPFISPVKWKRKKCHDSAVIQLREATNEKHCFGVGCAWLNWVSALVLRDVKIPLWKILKQDTELWWFLANSQHPRSPLQSTSIGVLCSQVQGVDGDREKSPRCCFLGAALQLEWHKLQMLFLPGKRSGKEQLQSNCDYDGPRQNSFRRCICWT